MDTAKDNIYLLLPANFSGDLWHVAAALVLSSRYAGEDNFPFNVVVAMVCSRYDPSLAEQEEKLRPAAESAQQALDSKPRPSNDDSKKLRATIQAWRSIDSLVEHQKQEKRFGSVSFNYFRNIGLERLLIEVDLGATPTKGDLDKIIGTMPNDVFKHYYLAQRGFTSSFEETLDRGDAKFSPPKIYDHPEQTRILGLMTATTIAMNFLCRQKKDAVEEERYFYLRKRMCSAHVDSVEAGVEAEATKKYDELKALVTEALKAPAANGKKYEGVVLENYRVNTNNYQTNSNLILSRFFKVFAEKAQLAVVAIPAVNDKTRLLELKEEKKGLILDLYGIERGEQYPGMEARAQCLFWAKVAADPHIAGIFGGRSGSIDVAAFNGMNAFYWDEAWINWCAGDPDFEYDLGPNNKKGRAYAVQQVPQCLRSLQLLGIMAVGLATNRVSIDEKRSQWQGVREEQLAAWFSHLSPQRRVFDLGKAIYPKLPAGGIQTWRLPDSINDWAGWTQENKDVPIRSHILDFIGFRSEKKSEASIASIEQPDDS